MQERDRASVIPRARELEMLTELIPEILSRQVAKGRKGKSILRFSELGVFAPLRRCSGHALQESCFPDLKDTTQLQIHNMFGWLLGNKIFQHSASELTPVSFGWVTLFN
jgi:hypothetical protein